MDLQGAVTCEELEPARFTSSGGAGREGNGISSMSSTLEPTCGGATVPFLTWSMWCFTTRPSRSSTTKEWGPCSAVILLAIHVGPV